MVGIRILLSYWNPAYIFRGYSLLNFGGGLWDSDAIQTFQKTVLQDSKATLSPIVESWFSGKRWDIWEVTILLEIHPFCTEPWFHCIQEAIGLGFEFTPAIRAAYNKCLMWNLATMTTNLNILYDKSLTVTILIHLCGQSRSQGSFLDIVQLISISIAAIVLKQRTSNVVHQHQAPYQLVANVKLPTPGGKSSTFSPSQNPPFGWSNHPIFAWDFNYLYRKNGWTCWIFWTISSVS